MGAVDPESVLYSRLMEQYEADHHPRTIRVDSIVYHIQTEGELVRFYQMEMGQDYGMPNVYNWDPYYGYRMKDYT